MADLPPSPHALATPLKNLRGPRAAPADAISDALFAYHVGTGCNHFANRIGDAPGDVAYAGARAAQTSLATHDQAWRGRGGATISG